MADSNNSSNLKKFLPAGVAAAAILAAGGILIRQHNLHKRDKKEAEKNINIIGAPIVGNQPSAEEQQVYLDNLKGGYVKLKQGSELANTTNRTVQDTEKVVEGYQYVPGYPSDFQADYFPALAGPGGKSAIMGPNMSYYFTESKYSKSPETGSDHIDSVHLNTTHLKTLMGVVYDQVQAAETPEVRKNTNFTMIIDADALDGSVHGVKRFEEKYLGVRIDDNAKDAQPAENMIIRNAFSDGTIYNAAEEMISEKYRQSHPNEEMPSYLLKAQVDEFLKNNFHFKTTVSDKAIDPVWVVDGPQGPVYATQILAPKTRNINRGLKMGTMPELEGLSQHPLVGKDAEDLVRTGKEMPGIIRNAALIDVAPAIDLHQRSASREGRS